MKQTFSFALITISLFALLPLSAYAALQRDGIFGCNQTGAYAMSVGSLNAIGGSSVPVADSAVTLNTGYLVYKECVLKPLINKEAQAADSFYNEEELRAFTKGNGGNPQFVTDFNQELYLAGNDAFNRSFNTVTGTLNTAYQSQVQGALARNYAMSTRAPQNSLACPYQGDLRALYSNQTFSWSGLYALANPSCDPVYSYIAAQNQLNANIAAAQNAWLTQANWGRGVLPIRDQNTGLVVTPGFLVGDIASLAATAGQRRLENANDIGQLVGPFMSGMANRILSAGCGGVAAVGDSACGQPPYLSQIRQEVGKDLQATLTNVARVPLDSALSSQQAYKQALGAITDMYIQAIAQLREEEKTCWSKIAATTCTASSTPSTIASGTTCTSASGTTLHITTSTDFSQAIIDSNITSYAQAVIANMKNSDAAIAKIQQLIVDVQNTTSRDVQANALSELDTLVANASSGGILGSPDDLKGVQDAVVQERARLSDSTTGLLPQTFKVWRGDGTDQYGSAVSGAVPWDGSSQNGWCNASNDPKYGGPATIKKWITKWSS